MQCKIAVQLHSSDSLLVLKQQLLQRAPSRTSLLSLPCFLYGQIPLSDDISLASLMVRQSSSALVTAEVTDSCVSITRISGVRYTNDAPWQPDAQFNALMRLHGMSSDPVNWTRPQLRLWLHWAAKKFRLPELHQPAWQSLTGRALAALTPPEFAQLCPSDAECGELWTHLKLLRRLHMAAVPQRKLMRPQQQQKRQVLTLQSAQAAEAVLAPTAVVVVPPPKPVQLHSQLPPPPMQQPQAQLHGKMRISRSVKGSQSACTTVSGSCGGELWKFLLDLLTDCRYRRILQWTDDDDGTFAVLNPSALATVWGSRRGNPRMTFAKMSRALRNYQRGGMLEKVVPAAAGSDDESSNAAKPVISRYVYRFLCDMPSLLGYSVADLRRLVDNQAALGGIDIDAIACTADQL